jgi:predicted ester cyclase
MTTMVYPSNAQQSKLNTIKEFYKYVEKGDFKSAGNMLSEEVKVTIPFSPTPMNKMEFMQLGMSMKEGFPNLLHHINESTESGNAQGYNAFFTGTNTGYLRGNPPTNNSVALPFLGFNTFDDKGKFLTMNISFDAAAFNNQLLKGIDINMKSKSIVKDYIKAADDGDFQKLLSLMSENHTQYVNGKMTNKTEIIERIKVFKEGFQDLKRNIETINVDGNTVIAKGTATGTHTGKLYDIYPTGKHINVSWIGIYQLDANYTIEKAWLVVDNSFMYELKTKS